MDNYNLHRTLHQGHHQGHHHHGYVHAYHHGHQHDHIHGVHHYDRRLLRSSQDHTRVRKFTDFLSPEAQEAMKQAVEDTAILRQTRSAHAPKNSSPKRDRSKKKKPPPVPRVPSYGELLDRNSTPRMNGDITDIDNEKSAQTEMNQRKRAIGGGKMDNALEMVEIVNADAPEEETPGTHKFMDSDDFFIDQIAHKNSVEKCKVWMEVNNKLPPISTSPGAQSLLSHEYDTPWVGE